MCKILRAIKTPKQQKVKKKSTGTKEKPVIYVYNCTVSPIVLLHLNSPSNVNVNEVRLSPVESTKALFVFSLAESNMSRA